MLDDEVALFLRFDAGEVVNSQGEAFKPEDLIQPGQDVWFYRIPAPEQEVPFKIEVIYQDDDLVVVDKPPFLATVPRGRHITETAVVKMRKSTNKPQLTPAHRLDRLTAGVLVMVANPNLRGAYQQIFASRSVRKTYEAIANYQPELRPAPDKPIIWKSRIVKEHGDVQAHVVVGEANALTSVISVTPVTEGEQQFLESVHGSLPRQARYVLAPATGKTHQLRLHMRDAGVPILGDPFYPVLHDIDAEDFRVPMHLLARELSFVDPISGRERSFSSLRSVVYDHDR